MTVLQTCVFYIETVYFRFSFLLYCFAICEYNKALGMLSQEISSRGSDPLEINSFLWKLSNLPFGGGGGTEGSGQEKVCYLILYLRSTS